MTADLVTDWAFGTLAEWLQGYTDYDDEAGCQFRIRHWGGDVFSVAAMDPYPGLERRFSVRVLVEELVED